MWSKLTTGGTPGGGPGAEGVAMAGEAGSGTLRELTLVVAVALAGLLLAMVAAFTPWHATPAGNAPAGLVELHSPGDLGSDPTVPHVG